MTPSLWLMTLPLLAALAAPPAPRAGAAAAVTVATAGPACRSRLLLEHHDRPFEALVEQALREAQVGKFLDDGSLAIAVVDLTDPHRHHYAGFNDNQMMYAASIPKLAILLAAVDRAAAGTLAWTATTRARLKAMITASSNRDASWAAERVGLPAIAQLVRDPRYCLYDTTHGGLWVGRSYRHGGPSLPDPSFQISHGATARQVTRFYALLDAGALISPQWSGRMVALMGPPAHHHKFVAGLAGREGVRFVARKSGTWRRYHGDSALIEHHGNRYAVTILTDLRKGEPLLRALVRIVDDVIMAGRHRDGKLARAF